MERDLKMGHGDLCVSRHFELGSIERIPQVSLDFALSSSVSQYHKPKEEILLCTASWMLDCLGQGGFFLQFRGQIGTRGPGLLHVRVGDRGRS